MNQISVGDKVKMSDYCIQSYPAWARQSKDIEFVVGSVKTSKVFFAELTDFGKALYMSKYGIQKEYECLHLEVELDGKKYITSQFFFNKV